MLNVELNILPKRKRLTAFALLLFAGFLGDISPVEAAEGGTNRFDAGTNQTTAGSFEFGSRGVRSHDPSTIVKCDDRYWVFHTGRGVLSYWSTNLVDWQSGPRVMSRSPEWVATEVPGNTDGNFWAPDIIRVGDEYRLYYSVSTFGKNRSVIALATTPTLNPDDPNFKWTDRGVVVRSFATNNFNAIDPALFQDQDGSLWMTFGSFWSGIQLIQLDPKTGLRLPGSPMHSLARYESIEAPFLCRRGDDYYLFVNWGICCRGTNSTYEIRVGKSRKVTGPYLDRDGVDLTRGGGTLVLKGAPPFIGPGHAGIFVENGTEWFSCHFYDGARRGTPTMALNKVLWTNGWPEVVFEPNTRQIR
jgi:Beta-xylosidase